MKDVRVRLTLSDIARLAEVSRTTASRVLNGRGEVRPEVRARVEKVIADTGYRPLASARSLVSRRSDVIGFVLPLGASAVLDDPYFIELIKAFGAATSARNLTAALFLFDEVHDQEAILDRVVGPRRVDGIVMSAYHVRDQLLDRLVEFDVPLVTMGENAYPDRVGSVTVDNFDGGRQVAVHLLESGRHRIGCVVGPGDTASGLERLAGFRAGLAAGGHELDEDLVREGDYTRVSGARLGGELLALGVDAMFMASDTMAIGAMEAARVMGIRVPDNVAIVGFDALPMSESTSPPLSTVRQPITEVVDAAVDALLEQIADPSNVSTVRLPVELVRRESSGAAK